MLSLAYDIQRITTRTSAISKANGNRNARLHSSHKNKLSFKTEQTDMRGLALCWARTLR